MTDTAAATNTSWEGVLTAMEDELDVHEEAVRGGSTSEVPAWEAPTGLGPLPPELADRARHLVERINLLSTFVKYHLQALDADREHIRRQEGKATANKAVALFLDASV